MRTRRQLTYRDGMRGVLPWLAGWLTFQGVLAIAGRVAARRRNEGDESTAGIRRVQTLGEVNLRPANPELSRVRLDLAMAGGVLDLTGIPRVPGGVDVTVRALMGGVAVRVPSDWSVWWHFRGVGGVGGDVRRTPDETHADLRLHVQALFGGVGVETAGAGSADVGSAA